MPSSVTLSTSYLPNLAYLKTVLQHECIVLEAHEHFIKQTFRNRCDIATSGGKLTLSIPLVKQADKEIITDKRISYAENWQQKHWRAIVSAYKNSPYFEFFEDEFKPFYETKHEFLFDYNLQLLSAILKILKQKKNIQLTSSYDIELSTSNDLRHSTLLKYDANESETPYYQVFSDKTGFIPNLSCIDALFNIGLKTVELVSST